MGSHDQKQIFPVVYVSLVPLVQDMQSVIQEVVIAMNAEASVHQRRKTPKEAGAR